MRYDYNKIEEYCNQISSINSDMQKQFNIIQNIINNISSGWTGSASDHYLKQIKAFDFKFEEFNRELNAMIAFLRKCSTSYENLDNKVKQEINDIISQSKLFI